jgi:hypothetical protein
MPRSPNEWKAAIVDQLSIDENLINTSFISEAASILNASGFEVEYFEGTAVDVGFYGDLPAESGAIVVLRAHSAVRDNTDYVDLFSSEIFQEGRYPILASERQISKAQMEWSDDWYFAVGPTFVNSSMEGRFKDSLVILMGCSSLNQSTMASALVAKGAKAVVGWTDRIDLGDTDAVTLVLLQQLLVNPKYTIGGAVEAINRRLFEILGHYPSFGARLAYYPSTAKNHLIETRARSSSSLLLEWEGVGSPIVSTVPKREAPAG